MCEDGDTVFSKGWFVVSTLVPLTSKYGDLVCSSMGFNKAKERGLVKEGGTAGRHNLLEALKLGRQK